MKDQDFFFVVVFFSPPFCDWMQLNCPLLVAGGTADTFMK